MASSPSENCCVICSMPMTDPRELKCHHSFCLHCLQHIKKGSKIECPLCKKKTPIKKDSSVAHLPRYIKEKISPPVKLLKVFEVDKEVVSIMMDEISQRIYVGRHDFNKPIEIFSYGGSPVGGTEAGGHGVSVWGREMFTAPRLALDTRRRLLLAAAKNYIFLLDEDGLHTKTIQCTELEMVYDIAYDEGQDRYIVVDSMKWCVIDPEVTTSMLPVGKDEPHCDNTMVCVASDKTGKSSMFVMTDSRSSAVRLYDGDGLHVKDYESKGSGQGQFDHPRGVCFDPERRLIISDSENHRLVCLSPDAASIYQQWSVLMDTKTHQLYHPRNIDITSTGIMAVVFWSALNGPFKVAVFEIPY